MEDVDHLRFFLVVVKPPKVTIKFVDVYVCNTLLFLFCWVQYYFGFWLILYNQLTLTKFGRSLPLYINTIKRDFFFCGGTIIQIFNIQISPLETQYWHLLSNARKQGKLVKLAERKKRYAHWKLPLFVFL